MFQWRSGPFSANSAGFGDGKNSWHCRHHCRSKRSQEILLTLCISLKFALKCLIIWWESSKLPPFWWFKMADSHHRIGYHNKYCTKMKFSTIELSESINRCIIFKILACLCKTMDESMDISAKASLLKWRFQPFTFYYRSTVQRQFAMKNGLFLTFKTLSNHQNQLKGASSLKSSLANAIRCLLYVA